MIKYLGSKRTLLPAILDAVRGVGGVTTVLDLFSGTARVGHALKREGYRTLSNDHNAYAACLARCYVEADAEDHLADAARLITELNALPGTPGYFTETFCERARFLHPKNGARVDAMRAAITAWSLSPELEAVLLTALMEAADRVDSTTGVQMAYLKQWAPRALKDIELRVPALLPRARHGKGRAMQREAVDAAGEEVDLAYLDPPYNQHSYLGNYHVWETLVRGDTPETYGVAQKRDDCRVRRSAFNTRKGCEVALREVLSRVRARAVVVSFSDEGYIPREALEEALGGLWGGAARVNTVAHDYKRYVGAQIGIYNPQGEKVGRVGHLRNQEYLFVATRAE